MAPHKTRAIEGFSGCGAYDFVAFTSAAIEFQPTFHPVSNVGVSLAVKAPKLSLHSVDCEHDYKWYHLCVSDRTVRLNQKHPEKNREILIFKNPDESSVL